MIKTMAGAWAGVLLAAVLLPVRPALAQQPGQQTKLAVFNFQMKTESPDWLWLEKLLSDQLTTDFATSRTLAVVARDEMQVLASQMNWVPEMAQDAGSMGNIAGKLEIAYLVSGVYSIDGERIEIIGQIVEIKTRHELFRKSVSGQVADVLDLQKKLSGELLGWLIKKPAAEVQATLPVWTKVLPAAKALYEGMDLYDHGRYAEAWLKFRSASRTDPDYLEALYWVGKMYYFMDRYEHARRALERFVYMDAAHPRIGDAIKEYLDTYEQLDTPPEVLLQLYDDFARRWPDAIIRDQFNDATFLSTGRKGKRWLDLRAALVLQGLGRHREAAELAGPAYHVEFIWSPIAVANVLLDRTLTGRNPEMKVLFDHPEYGYNNSFVVQFAPGDKEKMFTGRIKLTVMGPELYKKNLEQRGLIGRPTPHGPVYQWMALVAAPEHCLFKRIRLTPVTEGGDVSMTVRVHPADSRVTELVKPASRPLAQALKEGFVLDSLPLAGLLNLQVNFESRDPQAGSPVVINGMKIAAEFELAAEQTAIRVACDSTPDYRALVDGRVARISDGLIGPLATGEHVVRFEPLDDNSPFDAWQTTVKVEPGPPALVRGRLDWKKGSPWANWKTTLLMPSYPGPDLCLEESSQGRPQFVVEPDKVRMLWVYHRDVWSATSTDGQTFSAGKRLDLPVSSAWSEDDLCCLRDESGRYVLFLKSDRDAQHRTLGYVTWSRDFEHWSAPTVIRGKITESLRSSYRAIQDRQGRYLVATGFVNLKTVDGYSRATDFRLNMLTSDDGMVWQDLGRVLTLSDPVWFLSDFDFSQREDGTYQLLAFLSKIRASNPGDELWQKNALQVIDCRSADLKTWQVNTLLTECNQGVAHVSVVRRGQRTEAMLFLKTEYLNMASGGCRVLWRDDDDGPWKLSPHYPGIAYSPAAMAWRPTLGYVLAYMIPPAHEWSAKSVGGPYLLTGRSLEPQLAGSAPAKNYPLNEFLLDRPAVIIPPEAEAPATQPALPQFEGAASPQELLERIDEALVKEKGQHVRVLGPFFDPRQRPAQQRLLDLEDHVADQVRMITALAKANQLQSAFADLFSAARWRGISVRAEVASPLAAGRANLAIGQGGDQASFSSRGVDWPMVLVDGKWYLAVTMTAAECGRREQVLTLLVQAFDDVDKHIRAGKVTYQNFTGELLNVWQRVEKEMTNNSP